MTIRVINLQSGDESVRNYTTDEAIANASAVLPPTPCSLCKRWTPKTSSPSATCARPSC